MLTFAIIKAGQSKLSKKTTSRILCGLPLILGVKAIGS